jgi:predicted deacetylase
VTVHVSIHDVSPAWEREVDAALDLAASFGVRPALLVVPDFHGEAPLGEHPAYCERLRALEREGHEIYLHGYYHRARDRGGAPEPRERGGRGAGAGAAGTLRARARWFYTQRIVSGGEAEFSDVTREEAIERLDAGEQVLRDAGLTIKGFVAPAWSMPRWVLDLLAERGCSFTEDHTRVYDPASGRSRASVVMNYASRTPGRLFSSVAWCRIARPAARVLPTRIAIHPADMRFALLRSELASALAWGRRTSGLVGAAAALMS